MSAEVVCAACWAARRGLVWRPTRTQFVAVPAPVAPVAPPRRDPEARLGWLCVLWFVCGLAWGVLLTIAALFVGVMA